MATPENVRIDHLEFILGRILDKALPQGSQERSAVQAELDVIASGKWNNENINAAAKTIRSCIK